MHEPVHPVKIAVVQEKGYAHTEKEIKHAVRMNILINLGVLNQRSKEKQIPE